MRSLGVVDCSLFLCIRRIGGIFEIRHLNKNKNNIRD